jgi:Asp-tRNA(Asn)/Glu-tRNA(Gln) amidotransferase A subunit family amidase
MSEITGWSAAALARGIGEGRFTSAEVLEAFLARIDAVDGHVGAYVRVLGERARAEALARDAETRTGRVRGVLHGVPVAIKDLIEIDGVPMTAGSAFLGREPSRRTATVVRRLEAAGAVILGTTTLHEFALGMTSVNPHGRSPRNPWNLDCITGGSSGGSGAVVAAGLAPAALGSDTGGSIRIPAALCGIVGLKPTFGRVSRHGVLPLSPSFDTVGPMARTVEDAALILETIAGADPDDPAASVAPVPRYSEVMGRVPAGVRVGRLSGPFFETDLDPAMTHALDDAARTLEAAGIRVRPVHLKTVEEGQTAQITVLLAEAAAFHRARFPGRDAEYGPDVRRLLDEGGRTSPEAVERARAALDHVKAEVAEVLKDSPVLLGPALPIGAPHIADVNPHEERWLLVRRMLGRFSRLYNTTGLPSIALPAALTAGGLPVALQMAVAPWQEGLLLAVAHQLERAIGWNIPKLPRV